jgi:carbohydrate kinase (thermoresistant glucokinase family)
MAFDTILVVMGVSGSGKTTVAAMLAGALGVEFREGDDFHPRHNIEKMKSGTPLADEDRWPWLRAIAAQIDAWRHEGKPGIVTCSALKRAYRAILVGQPPDVRREVRLVYLRGSHELIRERMAARHGHFMPVGLLDSQFATLEEPGPDERPIVVDIGGRPGEIVVEIIRRLDVPPKAPV